jgi:membrane protease subunit HflK
MRRVLLWALAVAVIGWLCSGVRSLKDNEVGLVRRFGKFQRSYTKSGAKLLLPWPIERMDRVPGPTVKPSVRSGFATDTQHLHPTTEMSMPYCLTGDQNIIHVSVVIYYHVTHPRRYAYGIRDVRRLLQSVMNDAVVTGTAAMEVDAVLTGEKEILRDRAMELANEALDKLDAGVLITGLELETVEVPEETRQAFESVHNAKTGIQTQLMKAQKYRREILAQKRNSARQIWTEAEQFRHSRIQQAKGDAARFNALYEKYRVNKLITRVRMYLETMDKLMTRAKIRVVPAGRALPGRAPAPPVIRMPE